MVVNLAVTVRQNDFPTLVKILKDIRNIFSIKKINPAALSIIAGLMVKCCGFKVGDKTDPDAASRGKLVSMFKIIGLDVSKAAMDTSLVPNLLKPIDSKEYADGIRIMTYPQQNRVAISVNILVDVFLQKIDQNRLNPVYDHVVKIIESRMSRR